MLKVDLYWDLRSSLPERHTGVGKHVINVISGLLAQTDIDLRVLLAKDQKAMWSLQKEAYGWGSLTSQVLPFSNKAGRLLFAASALPSIEYLCRSRDVIYSPMELLLSTGKVPYINTIHGIPSFEDSIGKAIYASRALKIERAKQAWFFRRSRSLCQKSFVVSDYLKQRLVSRLQFAPDFLEVVYNGADEIFFDTKALQAPECSDATLLVVGGINALDGAEHLLTVTRLLKKERPSVKIRIVGDRHESPWYEKMAQMHNVVFCGFLNSADLLLEMKRSTALLYLPAVESFGIIGVEAMACGLPIIACRSTSLPEVLGDAPFWVDIDQPNMVLEAVDTILGSPFARIRYVETGFEQAANFHWGNVTSNVVSGLQRTKKHYRI
jgi:glycosyltransferase involved in cell wall biosynthesis